jgi:hypothetical protein
MSTDFDESERRIERAIDSALCELPLRKAPAGLEARVLAELSRRVALPWWRRSFASWPQIARIGFVLISIALAGLAFVGGVWALQNLGSPALGALSTPGARHLFALLTVAGQLASLGHILPAHWLYEGLVASTLLYVLLFGLGITAYRTLYLDPTSQTT